MTRESKFKIRDKVRIRRESNYYSQSQEIGEIDRIDKGLSHPYFVRFEGGYSNDYRAEDLELVHECFKKGDRVRWEKKYDEKLYKGLKGTVLDVRGDFLKVEWDKNIGGHNCGGLSKNQYGWEIPPSHVSLVKAPKTPKKKLDAKKAKIIKEIKSNKEFSKCFKSPKDIKEEVDSWEESKIINWK